MSLQLCSASRIVFGILALVLFFPSAELSRAAEIRISAKFPGGNILLKKIEGNTVHIAPDLRGGRPWFYWYFEAEVEKPGRVTFQFPADAGSQVGMNGPAVSIDDGETWRWLGSNNVSYRSLQKTENVKSSDSFFYDFTAENMKVRFSVGIPYLQKNLDQFVERIGDNPHLTRGVLARSLKGRPVAVWKIGRANAEAIPVLVSGRHHACEALASYVLEGFLEEALSDSRAGKAFRDKYVLFAVPIVDVDGVAEGDQGKWRSPHDHNRDYGQLQMRYPPVIELVRLAKDRKIELALDFHCPTIHMDIHQGFYFAGIARPHIKNNLDDLTAWLDEERPPAVIGRERDMMSKPGSSAPTGGMPFSNYFAYQDGVKFSATLESPFTQRGNGLDGDMAREYGKGLLRAWVRTEFVANPDERTESDSAKLTALRKGFIDVFKTKPDDAEVITSEYLNADESSAIFRIEANNLMGLLRFRQRKYDQAFAHFRIALSDDRATTSQRVLAATERARVKCSDTRTDIEDLKKTLEEFAAERYSSAKQRVAVHESAVTAFEARDEIDTALAHARSWFLHADKYNRGKALNRVANLLDKLGQNENAIQTRRQAVAVLRKELNPIPVGVFGPLMAAELLDALNGIPDSTTAEKTAAANIALNHKVKPPSIVRRIRESLREKASR